MIENEKQNLSTPGWWDQRYKEDRAQNWTIWKDPALAELVVKEIQLNKVEDTSKLRILVLGCGTGHAVESLFTLVPELKESWWTGLDFSVEAIGKSATRNETREDRLRSFDFVFWDLNTLPCMIFPDSTFDLVLCTEILEHLDNPKALVKECLRVSKGAIVFTLPVSPNLLSSCHRWQFETGDLVVWLGKLGWSGPVSYHMLRNNDLQVAIVGAI